MSRSTVRQSKSSPCCIGCIVLLFIALGLSLAVGIYMYKFAKNNISIVTGFNKPDPALDASPEQLLPPTVGNFQRVSLENSLQDLPQTQWQNLNTTSAHVAVYQDPQDHSVTVIAVHTDEAGADQQTGLGVLARSSNQETVDTAFTIKDTLFSSEANYITTWSKPNWTFMVQTTSTLTRQFLDNFNPGAQAEETPAAAPVTEAPSAPTEAATTTTEDQQTTAP